MVGTIHGTMAGVGTISIDTITHGDGIVLYSGGGITTHGITDHIATAITGDIDMQAMYLITTGSNLEDTILAETVMATLEEISV